MEKLQKRCKPSRVPFLPLANSEIFWKQPKHSEFHRSFGPTPHHATCLRHNWVDRRSNGLQRSIEVQLVPV